MLSLETKVYELYGVGERTERLLEKLDIKTVRDLLFYYPRRWEDFSVITPIAQAGTGEKINILAAVKELKIRRSPSGRMWLIHGLLEDETGELKVIWYNQPFLRQTLKLTSQWVFSGEVKRSQGALLLQSPAYIKQPRILPIYQETAGLTSKQLQRLIEPLTKQVASQISDFLPNEVRRRWRLSELPAAIQQIHFPNSLTELHAAKRRLSFDELLLINLRLQLIRQELTHHQASVIKIDRDFLQQFVASLPFQLTNDQRRTAWEIIKDLSRSIPMNRLLQGDVGSGKTVVAALAAAAALKQNHQVAYLAPTEILAQQQYNNLVQMLLPLEITVALLTSSVTQVNQCQIKCQNKDQKSKIKKLIQDNKIQLIVGTHAILQEDVIMPNLALIIVDEQHRFGVKQRAALRQHIAVPQHIPSQQYIPHFLSMTATPIPRTLALVLYGDLDVSVIRQSPIGRRPVDTRVVNPSSRQRTYDFIRQQAAAGRQIFVICPLIEEPTRQNLFDIDRKSVKKEYTKLSTEVFPDLGIGLLHGKMKAKEKEAVMRQFAAGKLSILVSTSVVEVGIDIPNATVMMIEGAEHFGLAQLHQFRGRVGRAEHQSYCFLFPESALGGGLRRLKIFAQHTDGFKLAEYDLKFRGPGELSGLTQHGLPDLKMASLTDTILLQQAREASRWLIEQGIDRLPLLKNKLDDFNEERFLE